MKMKRLTTMVLTLVMLAVSCLAMADTVSMDGQVVADRKVMVLVPIGGTVDQVSVSAGDHVEEGTSVLRLKTEKVYADQAGTVAIFGDVGDTVSAIEAQYGAVAVIEPDEQFTIEATTRNAYNTQNKLVHVGRIVYLRKSSDNGTKKGMGLITSASGSSFTVKVTGGELTLDDNVQIFSSEDYEAAHRIGSGTVSRVENLTYTGDGTIIAFHVRNRGHVEKGTLLYETLSGSFDPGVEVGKETKSPISGVVASVSASEGASISKNEAVCVIWPDDAMRIEASVSESDLMSIAAGDSVKVEFDALVAQEYQGTIERISRTAQDADASEAAYTVTVSFEGPENVLYGMHATVTREE